MSDSWSDLSQQVSILCDGWSERIEYYVRRGNCTEQRLERITHPPLLVQLRHMTAPLIRAKQEGGNGGKPGSKPPGAFQATTLIDEIGRFAHDTRAEWRAPTAIFRCTVARELHSLRDSAAVQPEATVRDTTWHLRSFVRRARIIIGHEAPTRAYANTVCGECGGQLRAPIDGAGPVFCAGTPESAPCGNTYTQTDVIRLAMELEATNGTEAC